MGRKNKLKVADFDFFAECFEQTRAHLWREATEFIDSVPKGASLLDVGAGGGRHAVYAAKEHNVVALDISRKMIKILKGKGSGVFAVIADAASLPFREGAFDGVLCVAAIHHLRTGAQRRDVLCEFRRVLGRRGKFLASAWALEQEKLSKLADKNGDLQYTWDKKFPRFYHLFCEGELLRIAKSAGFTKLNEWRSGNNWWVEGKKG